MEFYKRENNNFNLVRMIAAYTVIYAHSYAIQPNGSGDIITRISHVTHAGQLSVFIFVFLTGVYLFVSLRKTDSVTEFWIKKFMRIYPMLVLTLVSTIIIGAIFTTYSLKDYLKDSMTRKYFIDNLINISNAHELPGVFADHNFSGVNGVLWYVTFIVRLYFLGGLAYCIGLFSNKERMNVTLLIFLIWVMVRPNSMPFLGGNPLLYGNPDFPQYTITIIISCLICNNFSEIRVKWQLVLFASFICLVQKDFTYENSLACWAVLAITSAVYMGCNSLIKNIKVIDCSYEVFLFGWPLSQVVCELGPNLTPVQNTLITIIVATIWALLLHFTVEKWIEELTKTILRNIEKEKNNGQAV